MSWPLDLALLRHGESEGNVAHNRSKRGDHSLYTPEFRRRHSTTWRLTNRGLTQPPLAGAWVRANIDERFDVYLTSNCLRAVETAAHLGLPDARWRIDANLRERERGRLDVVSQDELTNEFAPEMLRRLIDGFHWRPPGGESMDDVCQRVDIVLNSLRQLGDNQRAIVVCHGEVLWAFRLLLEGLPIARFLDLEHSSDPRDRMNNGQVLHYTRRDPDTGVISSEFQWTRSVCTTDLSRSHNVWERIRRPLYSNDELLSIAASYPRFIE